MSTRFVTIGRKATHGLMAPTASLDTGPPPAYPCRVYPIALKLAGRRCVVIGGGAVAARKVDALLAAGAHVVVVAPVLCDTIAARNAAGEIEHHARPFGPADLEGALLAIAATDAPDVNAAVSEAAQARGILVNVVDEPELCSFFVPAVVRRGDVMIAISTGGSSPALARRIREELQEQYGDEYAALAELLSELRPRVLETVPSESDRRRIWREMLASDALKLLAAGDPDAARQALEAILARFT
ncbi:MAG: NAD(P)-dependent oxidoreductase [Armatimonadota bacterium]